MGDGGAPVRGEDHQSAAVRLLRSVAPWTAPGHVEADTTTSGEASSEPEQDRSLNGSGISSYAIFIFLFLLFGLVWNAIPSGPDHDGPRWDVSSAIIVGVVGVGIALMWVRRLASRARLRRVGMRADAEVTYVQPPLVSGILGQRVAYRYETKGGSHRGHATLGRHAQPLKSGDQIAILYDIAQQDVSLVD